VTSPTIRIQHEAFDAGAEARALRAGRRDIGALVSFEGLCRDHDGDALGVSELELEHYPGMTEAAIAAMVDDAQRRWPLQAVTVIHRVGRLQPGDPIVLVIVASAHRRAAFDACAFLMDYLKTQAPLWKKQTSAAGAAWVDAREADDAALARWGVDSNNSGGR
jgi:molybdopterin synthase catalytic subunit